MKMLKIGLSVVFLWMASNTLASGPLGISGIIERVEFEPGAEAPERVRVHGVFALYEDSRGSPAYTTPMRGSMYFSLPGNTAATPIRNEWSDLAAVAGSGEAVAFGYYGFSGRFGDLSVDADKADGNSVVVGANGPLNLAVSPVDAPAENPFPYRASGVGVVKLGEGNYDALVAALEAALAP